MNTVFAMSSRICLKDVGNFCAKLELYKTIFIRIFILDFYKYIVTVHVHKPNRSSENYKHQVGLRFCVDISRKCFDICMVTVVNI